MIYLLVYVKQARSFVDNFVSDPNAIRWTRLDVDSGDMEEVFIKSTREFAVRKISGPQTGAMKTYFKVYANKTLEQYAKQNGYTGPWTMSVP